MSKVKVVTPSGKGGKDVELPAEFFDAKVNIPLMHQVVVAQQALARKPLNPGDDAVKKAEEDLKKTEQKEAPVA